MRKHRLARIAFGLGMAVAMGGRLASAEDDPPHPGHAPPAAGPPRGAAETSYRPVITPDGISLPFRRVDGVKVFHLVAEPVHHRFAPGLEVEAWGYNGHVHGPTIEAVEGDRVRIYVTNRLPAATSIHWHGIHLPSGMDGVAGMSHRAIEPGETFRYEFTLNQHGTFLYHPHHDEMVQMAMGLMGLFVVHPREPEDPPADRDFAILLSEWRIDPGTRRPDPNEMTDFNVSTFNAKVFPATSPLVARRGDRVRLRIGNLSATNHHPIHLHGHSFRVVATDGGPIPEAGRWPETTVLVPVGSTRTVEFVADTPGDWALHCHMPHHTMNQMAHGLPNAVGADAAAIDRTLARVVPELAGRASTGPAGGHGHAGPAAREPSTADEAQAHAPPPLGNAIPMLGAPGPRGYIAMGGMFTVLKVREGIAGYDDPGWYENPPGTEAGPASEEELRRDGIDVGAGASRAEPAAAPPAPEPHRHGHGR